jgi:hypothetical protein
MGRKLIQSYIFLELIDVHNYSTIRRYPQVMMGSAIFILKPSEICFTNNLSETLLTTLTNE